MSETHGRIVNTLDDHDKRISTLERQHDREDGITKAQREFCEIRMSEWKEERVGPRLGNVEIRVDELAKDFVELKKDMKSGFDDLKHFFLKIFWWLFGLMVTAMGLMFIPWLRSQIGQ